MKKIAVLISGSGSNLQALIDACNHKIINGTITLVISNRSDAFGIQRAKKHGIETIVISKKGIDAATHNTLILKQLKKKNIDLVVLAGYLSILTSHITSQYPIINIHPSLIPAFCGLGFYGMKVHEAVIKSGVKFTGCTTHFVDEGVDTGKIIDQAIVPVVSGDTPETISKKVLKLEHELLVKTIKAYCNGELEK